MTTKLKNQVFEEKLSSYLTYEFAKNVNKWIVTMN